MEELSKVYEEQAARAPPTPIRKKATEANKTPVKTESDMSPNKHGRTIKDEPDTASDDSDVPLKRLRANYITHK